MSQNALTPAMRPSHPAESRSDYHELLSEGHAVIFIPAADFFRPLWSSWGIEVNEGNTQS